MEPPLDDEPIQRITRYRDWAPGGARPKGGPPPDRGYPYPGGGGGSGAAPGYGHHPSAGTDYWGEREGWGREGWGKGKAGEGWGGKGKAGEARMAAQGDYSWSGGGKGKGGPPGAESHHHRYGTPPQNWGSSWGPPPPESTGRWAGDFAAADAMRSEVSFLL